MAFGANSKIFTQFINSIMENVTAVNLSSDALKCALYNNTGTPNQDDSLANTAYNVGQWVTANEVYHAAHWAQAGQALGTITHAPGTATWTLDAADTASVDSATTLANVYGCLIYDDTLAAGCVDEGLCFLSFGGVQSVTTGTFTVVYNATGIFQLTL
jgi:hypothetical protein